MIPSNLKTIGPNGAQMNTDEMQMCHDGADLTTSALFLLPNAMQLHSAVFTGSAREPSDT